MSEDFRRFNEISFCRCASPPECEQSLPQPRHQEQSGGQWEAGRREASCSLTPMMRALIELEETRATESRAPCKTTTHINHLTDPSLEITLNNHSYISLWVSYRLIQHLNQEHLCVIFLCRGRHSEDHSRVCGAETQRRDSGASRASEGGQGGGQTRRSRGQSWARRRQKPQWSGAAESSEEFVSGGPQIVIPASSSPSKHSPNDTQYVFCRASHSPHSLPLFSLCQNGLTKQISSNEGLTIDRCFTCCTCSYI